MKHFIYKTVHKNGKYYIGRHSTENIDDGYNGSGRWVNQIKDKSELTREIVEYANTFDELILLEDKYLSDNFGKPNCMNMSNKSTGWAIGSANPMNNPNVIEKFKGKNHYLNRKPELRDKIAGENHWMNKQPEKKHEFINNHPNLDGRNARLAYERGTHNAIANNPSTINAAKGTHHWQNGKSPNYQGKLNKKLIEESTHNFLGPALNKKRVENGTHNFLGSESNQRRLAAGTHPSQQKVTCEHCGKTSSLGMHKRWHGDNCKSRRST